MPTSDVAPRLGPYMLHKRAPQPRTLPGWVALAASLFVVVHFFALVSHVLAARSGPWLVPGIGPSPAEPPMFAGELNRAAMRYLEPLRLTGDYHYLSNRVDMPQVQFEAVLRDENNNVMQTLQFPSPRDNFWVRQRQSLLAEALGGDLPVQLPRGEMIPAKDQQVETITVWYPPNPQEKKVVLRETPQHLVKDLFKDPTMQLSRPRDWTMLVARSYARYLGRKHGAASVTLVRQSRDPIMPALLLMPDEMVMPGTFDTLSSQFEEYRHEK